MADLREDIERIYKYLYIDTQGAQVEGKASKLVEGKASIEILQQIELRLNDHMRLIKFVHDYGDDRPY